MARPEQGWDEKRNGKLVMTPIGQLSQDPSLPDAVFTTGHPAGGKTPVIVPPGTLVAAVCESARLRYKGLTGDDYNIESVGEIVSQGVVLPGDAVGIHLSPRLVDEGGYFIIDLGVKLKIGDTTCGGIDTVTIRLAQNSKEGD